MTTMEPAYLSAVAVLAGSVVGGVTSMTGSWLSQYAQLRAQRQMEDVKRREGLYRQFIEEASRLYIDAFEHNEAQVSNLIGLYSLISMMRVVSPPEIVASAEKVARVIIETYLAPNRTFRDVAEFIESDMDPLRDFSNACRAELGTSATGAPLQNLPPARDERARRDRGVG